MSVRVVFIGTGSFGVPALRALAEAPDVELAGVVTSPARPAGRHGSLRPSPVAEVAEAIGVPAIRAPERLRRPEAVADVAALRSDLIVLADYGQIVPRALLDVRLGALNLHPSLLPRHRGASPIPATILAGEIRTGVTLMRMDEGLDTGPIVAISEATLDGTETSPDLESALAVLGAQLLVRSLEPWVIGELKATPQSREGATRTRPLRREDGRLDPWRSAARLERQVRAFQPWPGSWFDVDGGRYTVWRADLRSTPPGRQPGDLSAHEGRLLLTTTDGALDLVEMQPAGGRRMSGEELLRGRPALQRAHVEGPAADVVMEPIEVPVGYSGLR